MKEIKILGVNGSIQLLDDNDDDISVYSKEMLSVFSSPNVVVIETTSGVALVRPNRVDAIVIKETTETEINTEEDWVEMDDTTSQIETKVVTSDEDIILDGD